jgi:hypothetical protein
MPLRSGTLTRCASVAIRAPASESPDPDFWMGNVRNSPQEEDNCEELYDERD